MAEPNENLIACAEREIRFRERVYARRVADKKMTVELANREILLMREILAFLREHAPKPPEPAQRPLFGGK